MTIKNADMPAMPMSKADSIKFLQGDCVLTGLSKREHITAMAMQGFISAGGNGMPTDRDIAQLAVKYADALLNEIERLAE
jgi:hypothetical protein